MVMTRGQENILAPFLIPLDMDVLVISPYLPACPSSGSPTRVFKFLEQLSCAYRITLVLLTWRQTPELSLRQLGAICHRVEVLPLRLSPLGRCLKLFRRVIRWQPAGAATLSTVADQIAPQIQKLISKGNFSVIHAEDGVLAGILSALNADGAKKILSLHNVDSIRYQRRIAESERIREKAEAYWEWRAHQRVERKLGNAADFILAVSEQEVRQLSKHIPRSRIAVIPNGVDTSYYQPRKGPHVISRTPVLLFTGHMGWRPNVQAMLYFYRQILPLVKRQIPNVHLKIVGMHPTREILALRSDPAVEVTGWVDDVRPYFETADVFVAPLRSGSGTRLKILEAWAMGTPVVSTHIGSEGLHGQHGHHLLVADTPERFAESVIELLEDRSLAQRLAEEGRELVEREYDWRIVGEKLRAVYRQLLSPPDSSRIEEKRVGGGYGQSQ